MKKKGLGRQRKKSEETYPVYNNKMELKRPNLVCKRLLFTGLTLCVVLGEYLIPYWSSYSPGNLQYRISNLGLARQRCPASPLRETPNNIRNICPLLLIYINILLLVLLRVRNIYPFDRKGCILSFNFTLIWTFYIDAIKVNTIRIRFGRQQPPLLAPNLVFGFITRLQCGSLGILK